MDFALTLPMRWMLLVGISVLLWVLPIVIQAPALIILFCLIASIGGFVYSAIIAGMWEVDDRRDSKRRIQREEIENYSLALEEQSIKAELLSQYSWVPEVQVSSAAEPERLEACTEGLEGMNLNGDDEQVHPESVYYTKLNLTSGELGELLPKLKQTMTKAQIIDQLWGVKKGGSKAYKQASEQFDFLVGVGDE
jgi:hypothetical protein